MSVETQSIGHISARNEQLRELHIITEETRSVMYVENGPIKHTNVLKANHDPQS